MARWPNPTFDNGVRVLVDQAPFLRSRGWAVTTGRGGKGCRWVKVERLAG